MGVVRVQLHDETDYEAFHEEMENRGFTRTIVGDSGKLYALPHATYFKPEPTTAGNLRQEAADAASAIGAKAPKMVIATSGHSSWSGLKVVAE